MGISQIFLCCKFQSSEVSVHPLHISCLALPLTVAVPEVSAKIPITEWPPSLPALLQAPFPCKAIAHVGCYGEGSLHPRGKKEQCLQETGTASLPWATHKGVEEEFSKPLLAMERGGRGQKGEVHMGEKPWTAAKCRACLCLDPEVSSLLQAGAPCVHQHSPSGSSWSLSHSIALWYRKITRWSLHVEISLQSGSPYPWKSTQRKWQGGRRVWNHPSFYPCCGVLW